MITSWLRIIGLGLVLTGLLRAGGLEPCGFENMVGDIRDTAQKASARYESDAATARSAANAGESAMSGAESAMDAYDALSDLDQALADATSEPRGNAPPIPVSCAGREGCAECFTEAYDQLGRARLLLARAQTIYTATHRVHDTAVAIGDSLAPSTREAAFVWKYHRGQIEKSLDAFDEAYDRKIEGMLGNLKNVLKQISDCEARFYNNPDWYTRYGFIYLEFMTTRYSRH